jgi:hypothetical protein
LGPDKGRGGGSFETNQRARINRMYFHESKDDRGLAHGRKVCNLVNYKQSLVQ